MSQRRVTKYNNNSAYYCWLYSIFRMFAHHLPQIYAIHAFSEEVNHHHVNEEDSVAGTVPYIV